MITTINAFRNINETFDNSKYLKWKRANVSLRGVQELGSENGHSTKFGKGLYTAALSNREMAKKYGAVYFVVNGRPKNPIRFPDINRAEIWIYNNLYKFYDEESNGDIRKFNEKTSIDKELVKMGYDGLEITGREYVNYKPEDIRYFSNERQLLQYYEHAIMNESYDNLSDDILMIKPDTLEPIDPEVWEIDQIVGAVTDPKDIKKYENAGSNLSTDLTVKSVEVGQILWLTALLKPRNKSIAYPIGEMGVIKVKVMETFYGLNKLSQLKSQGKL